MWSQSFGPHCIIYFCAAEIEYACTLYCIFALPCISLFFSKSAYDLRRSIITNIGLDCITPSHMFLTDMGFPYTG